MKQLVLAILGVSLLLTQACEKKAKLDNDKSKASYAIGQQIGQNLKSQNIDIDADALSASIKDAVSGKESKMTQEEIQQALMKLQETMTKKSQEDAEKNATEGKKFLEENKAKPGIVTKESGLQIQMLTEGTGPMPKADDTVKVHYKGTLIDGKQFDSSYDRGQPAEFPVGGVIKGWTEALLTMKAGSKAKLFIPADLAYGASQRPGIPANSVLIFEVELIEVVAKVAPKADKKK